MNNENIQSAADNDLQNWLNNALATEAECIGHSKSYWNMVLANKYRDELISRGHEIPSIDEYENRKLFSRKGEYNGIGST